MRPYLLASAALAASTLATGLAGLSAAAADGAPSVLVSIAPIHSLVAGVMAGVGEPVLLVKGGASPHTYALKPSDAAALASADVVFRVGPGLEAFLDGPLETLAGKAKVVELAGAPGLRLLPVREGGVWEEHDHGHEGGAAAHGHDEDDHDEDAHAAEAAGAHGHTEEAEHGKHGHAEAETAEAEHADAGHQDAHAADAGHTHNEQGHDDHAHDHHHHEGSDMHLWLDPRNATAMTRSIVAALSAADPDHAATYAANGAAVEARIAALDDRLATELAPVRGKPFIVFHDAYQYFDDRYGLTAVGAITVNPDRAPGAERILEIRAKITGAGAVCVFSEPQFEPRIVTRLVEDTGVRTGVLDPDAAAGRTPGPDLYFELMADLADGLVHCLDGSS